MTMQETTFVQTTAAADDLGNNANAAQAAALRSRRCVLHIGLEKTGTTTIQNRLASNRERLLERGILYPRSAGRSNHLHLVSACLDFGVWDNIKANQLAVLGLTEAEWR